MECLLTLQHLADDSVTDLIAELERMKLSPVAADATQYSSEGEYEEDGEGSSEQDSSDSDREQQENQETKNGGA